MNPKQREHLEPRLTALLLGELGAQEATELQQAMKRDPELAATYERLKQTIVLVREITASPAEPAAAQPAPLKLSDDRSQKLLAHFKTVELKESAPQKSRGRFRLLELAAVVAITGILASTLLPTLSSSKEKSRSVAIRSNLRQLDSAKRQWAEENQKSDNDTPTFEDLKPYMGRGSGDPPPAVAKESYVLGKVSEPVAAEFEAGSRPPIRGFGGDKTTERVRLSVDGTVTTISGNAVAMQSSPADPVTTLPDSASAISAQGSAASPIFLPAKSGDVVSLGTATSGNSSYSFGTQGLIDTWGLPGSEAERKYVGGTQFSYDSMATPAPQQQMIVANTTLSAAGGKDDTTSLGLAWRTGTPVPTPSLSTASPREGTLALGDSLAPEVWSDTSGRYLTRSLNEPRVNFITNSVTVAFSATPRPPATTALLPLSPDSETHLGGVVQTVDTPALVRDARLYFELGKLEQAEAKLKEALKEDPNNKPARYYADLVEQAQQKPSAEKNPVRTVTMNQAGEELAAYKIQAQSQITELDSALAKKPEAPAPIPQPEIQTRNNAFSTFSLNVSDVSFKLAAASLEKGVMPEPASIRTEEFINAFDYRDPEPAAGAPIAFVSERARYPFAHNRDLLRFSVKTAAAGRQPGRPLNLVLLLDNSGSMERADRVRIIQQALRVLATQLQPQDKLSVVTFARTPRLWIDGLPGDKAGKVADEVSGLTPQGGTNLEEAMNLGYATAFRHYLANGINRVVLLTDGAANLGNVDPDTLKQKVEANRRQGVALDCFGIGWEGFNDDLLETLSRNGDGRYGFINSPEEAATEFAGQLAGALKVAASDVKVQVEFNPKRVTSYRQIGYAKHQLTKEQFRDNTVDAAEIAAAESGNALYTVEMNPAGEGAVCTVRVRYKVPGTADYREQEWTVPFTGNAVSLDQAGSAMRLAATASAFSEWLASSPFAVEVTPDKLLNQLGNAPESYGADARPKKLEWMIRQAKSLSGK